MTNEQQHKNLQEKWKKLYPEHFTFDGPSNWESWNNAKPKILFLAKETYNDYHSGNELPDKIIGKFFENIARWRFAINELYSNRNIKPQFPSNELFRDVAGSFNDIAVVEVKKLNENKSGSNNSEILKFAKRDKDLLRQQIALINPNIILCFYTKECFNVIHDDISKNYERLSDAIETCSCWKFENNLVIDFYHPSQRRFNAEKIFNILCDIIIQGKVFDKFDW